MSKSQSILLIGILCIAVVGCSGGTEVTDAPPPVKADNPNKFQTALEGGNGSAADDGAGKSAKGAGEGN